jgi:hypothetical protein
MRKLLGLVVLMALASGCTVYPEQKAPSWAGATRSERFNQLFWHSVETKDWARVEEHMAPLAIFRMGDQQASGKADVLNLLKSADVQSVQIGDVESQPAGADLVTSYTVTFAGKPPMHAMTVWQQAGKHWVIVAHSSSLTQK